MLGFAHIVDYVVHAAAPYLIGVAVVLWAIAFAAAAVSVIATSDQNRALNIAVFLS